MANLEIGALVVIIVAVCEAVKRAGLNKRYTPLLAIILGVVGSLYFGGASWLVALSGVITGLTTSGLYDFTKKTVLGK